MRLGTFPTIVVTTVLLPLASCALSPATSTTRPAQPAPGLVTRGDRPKSVGQIVPAQPAPESTTLDDERVRAIQLLQELDARKKKVPSLLVTCDLPVHAVVGEPITVTVWFKNVSNAPITVVEWGRDVEGVRVHVQRQTEDHRLDKAGREDHPGVDSVADGVKTLGVLQPSDRISQEVRLDDQWQMDVPGYYTLAIEQPGLFGDQLTSEFEVFPAKTRD